MVGVNFLDVGGFEEEGEDKVKPKFLFADIVVVEKNLIGVILKTWISDAKQEIKYDVYVRSENSIEEFREDEVERYRVRHKELDDTELHYQSLS